MPFAVGVVGEILFVGWDSCRDAIPEMPNAMGELKASYGWVARFGFCEVIEGRVAKVYVGRDRRTT